MMLGHGHFVRSAYRMLVEHKKMWHIANTLQRIWRTRWASGLHLVFAPGLRYAEKLFAYIGYMAYGLGQFIQLQHNIHIIIWRIDKLALELACRAECGVYVFHAERIWMCLWCEYTHIVSRIRTEKKIHKRLEIIKSKSAQHYKLSHIGRILKTKIKMDSICFNYKNKIETKVILFEIDINERPIAVPILCSVCVYLLRLWSRSMLPFAIRFWVGNWKNLHLTWTSCECFNW